jgi:hypothetical protein
LGKRPTPDLFNAKALQLGRKRHEFGFEAGAEGAGSSASVKAIFTL